MPKTKSTLIDNALDAMIAKDVKEKENSEKQPCNHFTRAIRLTRTLKFLSQKRHIVCRNCKSEDSIWICLYCCNFGCGRYISQHAAQHYETDKAHHCISVTVLEDDVSFWCYQCDDALIPDPSVSLLWECRLKLGKVLNVRVPKLEKGSMIVESGVVPQSSVKAVIPGLLNLGNTCFFNSCLFHSVKINSILENSSQSIASNSVLEAFLKVFKIMREKYLALEGDPLDKSASSPLNPVELFQRISRKWKVYSQFRQQDSHELLIRLLDLMDIESKQTMPDAPSLVKQAFGGELASLIVCDACESLSMSKEEYVVLSLSIPIDKTFLENSNINDVTGKLHEMSIQKSERTNELLKKIVVKNSDNQITLLQCLEKFMEVEILDGENKRECEECKKKIFKDLSLVKDVNFSSDQCGLSKSFKRYLLFSTPPILVFHLKRFQSLNFFKTKKIDTFIQFDEYLEMGPFMMPETSKPNDHQTLRYQLYALVVHGGSLLGGHYVSYVRPNNYCSWFYCSDSHTRSALWDEVRKSQAYLLYYKLI